MFVLVVATGLLVVGGDTVFVTSSTLNAGPDRLTMDGIWTRDSQQVLVIPMRSCDMRDIVILSRASNPAQPNRARLDLPHFIYRPGDINMNGVTEPSDFIAFNAMPYDYNLDGQLNGSDYFEVLSAISNLGICE